MDASGDRSGDVQVQGRRVTISDGSAILSNTLGAGDGGGDVTVEAAEVLELRGVESDRFVSTISNDVFVGVG